MLVDSDFSSLFDLLPIGAYRSSPDGRQLRANAALVKLNGYSSESEMLSAVENIATEWYCDPSRRDEFIAMLYSQTRVVDFVSEVYRHKTRERIWVREHAHLVSGVDGQPLYFEGTVQDITLEHLNYLNLQASETRFRSLTALSCDWYWELDPQFRFVRLDVGERSQSVGIGHHVIGKTRQDLGYIDLSAEEWVIYQNLLETHQVFHDFELPIHDPQVGKVWQSISGEPIFDAYGGFAGYRGVGRDVTSRKLNEEMIRQLAFHDPLTGLANRRLFMDRLQQTLTGMVRSGQCGVLIYLDLDKFKYLNDMHGHSAGDLYLQQVARRLEGCVRSVDTVARLGGDEFTIVLNDAGSSEDLACRHGQLVANKVMFALKAPFHLVKRDEMLSYEGSASLGFVVLTDPFQSVEECLKRADAAMYSAKGNKSSLDWLASGKPASVSTLKDSICQCSPK
ncbi:sensor domain-containing diguanylate cyclase [Rhodoferax sp.]|uniref:sensor domain-containing diguanylate cyclase n=1 Tax=Rhodoferax sp. TaxID=50421 RepID=UPI0025D0E515|nr:sensor domain-containing diguanylate cyclase [Rhodoferax sp.]